MSAPAVQRMLMDEIDRLERDNLDLSGYREKYHQTEKRVAVLEESEKTSLARNYFYCVHNPGFSSTWVCAISVVFSANWIHYNSIWRHSDFWRHRFQGGEAMKIKIDKIKDKGIIDKERVVIRVISNTDIGDYLLLLNEYYEDDVTSYVHKAYWFPYKRVKAGDLVVIYSKAGKDGEKELKEGGSSHFYYWGMKEAIWNAKNMVPVIVYAPEWEHLKPSEM